MYQQTLAILEKSIVNKCTTNKNKFIVLEMHFYSKNKHKMLTSDILNM